MNFESFNLSPALLSTIKAQGFTTPTPIQNDAIPVVMSGRDVMGLAQTGTGKTAAFMLPILQKLSSKRANNIRTLIIAPTRELAQQICDVASTFGRPLKLRAMTIVGGASMYNQIKLLRRGVDIVVACPGRLLDHMERNTIDLSEIETLVLDEADQMFDMGFIPNIRRIVKALPSARQTLLFSATMPADIRILAEQILKTPVTVKVNNTEPIATVTHALFPVSANQKPTLVTKLLEKTATDSVLIFVRTKQRAKRLARHLEQSNFNVTSLQGNLSPGARKRAMQGFRDGTFQIMVATDIAARGIDISSISHVINFDMPDTVEAYTHRIGRTGRAAKDGDAFTLVTHEDGDMIRSIERNMKAKLERRTLSGFEYTDVPRLDDAIPSGRRVPTHPSRSRGPSRRFGGGNRPWQGRGQRNNRSSASTGKFLGKTLAQH